MTSAEPDATGPTTPTRWGDREQRRRDIVDAARARIAEHGYLALTMRDLAADAGVGPATLYSYFATKEELFATLYADELRHHSERLRAIVAAGHDLAGFLEALLAAHVELYRTYGKHFTMWSDLRGDTGGGDGRFPVELVRNLRDLTIEQSRLLMGALRDIAAAEGRELVDRTMAPALLWVTLNGVADHLTTERRLLDRFEPDQLVRFTAERLVLALTERT